MAEMALRAPTRDDAAAIAGVLNAHGRATGGSTAETAAAIESWFGLESLDPANDMFVALESGTVAGYADVAAPSAARDGGPGVVYLDVRALPGRDGALDALLDAVLRRACERAPSGAPVRATASEGDEPYRAALARRGFQVVRSSFTMEIDLAAPSDAPTWPEGLRSRPFARGEERAVYDAYVEAFADHWGFVPESFADWCTWHLGEKDDRSSWRVADDRGAIAGLCLTSPTHGDDESLGWANVLAVRRPWRRRGLARALLLESFALLRSLGRARAGLGVDAENTTGALDLYRGVGMHVTRRWDTWERAL